MKLDLIINSPEQTRQQLSEMFPGADQAVEVVASEIGRVDPLIKHAHKLKIKRSEKRKDRLHLLLEKSIHRIEKKSLPVTIRRAAYGLLDFREDESGFRIIERIDYDSEKMEECVIWNNDKDIEKTTLFSEIARRLRRAGIKYTGYR